MGRSDTVYISGREWDALKKMLRQMKRPQITLTDAKLLAAALVHKMERLEG